MTVAARRCDHQFNLCSSNILRIDAADAATLVVESRHPSAQVARDGEVDMLQAPVRYRIRPRALRVIAPLPQESA